jgi:hypothetical protein
MFIANWLWRIGLDARKQDWFAAAFDRLRRSFIAANKLRSGQSGVLGLFFWECVNKR